MTNPTTRIARGRRIAYLRGNRYGLALALLAILTSATFLLGSHDAPLIEQTLGGHWPAVGALSLYGVGGLFVVYGLARPEPVTERAGLLMLAGVVSFYVFAMVYQLGLGASWQTALMNGLFVACFLDRAYEITRALGSRRGR